MPKKRRRDAGLGYRRAKKNVKNDRRVPIATVVIDDNEDSSNDRNDNNNENTEILKDALVVNNIRNKNIKNTVLSPNARRTTIAWLFVHKYNGLDFSDVELSSAWHGRNGVIKKIKADLGYDWTTKVRNMEEIFMSVIECARMGVPFDASKVFQHTGGREAIVKATSTEAQIIVDGLESGLSVKRTWLMVNEHRRQSQLEALTLSAVQSAVARFKPKVVKVKKRKQGSTDPNNPWSMARYRWVTQLLVRFGVLDLEGQYHGPTTSANDSLVPACFRRDIAGPLELTQVVWWDETHKKCVVGGVSASRNFFLRFRRDANGKFDPEGGNFSDEEVHVLNCKYEQEGRFGLGCALVEKKDVNGMYLPPEGKLCHLFDYSSRVLLSVDDYNKKQKDEIRRVKALVSSSSKWVENGRVPNTIYHNDCVTKLKGIAKETKKKLEAQGIKTVGDLKILTEEQLIELSIATKMRLKTLRAFSVASQDCIDEDIPPTIDHRKADNPYKSKYGEANWENELKNCSHMKTYCCITDYIQHIHDESAAVIQGTRYENTWYFYHDALALMTSKTTKKWMLDQGIYKRWILPSEDLYFDSPELKKRYGTNPLGNSPEFMPWDSHLNNDVHCCHDYHVAVSKFLPEENPHKFSDSTPKRLSQSYKRLLSPEDGVVPTPLRIKEDIERVIKSLQLVYISKGALTDTSSARSGRRFVDGGEKKKKGGVRIRKQGTFEYSPGKNSTTNLHRDLVPYRNEIINKAKVLAEQNIARENDDSAAIEASSS